LLTSLLGRTVMRLENEIARLLPARGQPFQSYAQFPPDLLKVLIENLFVVPHCFDEIEFARARHENARQSKSTMNLIITPTLGCNMGCYYCFEKRTAKQLNESNIEALATLVATRLGEYQSLHVQWFGGEPLLALDLLRKTTLRLQRVIDDAGKELTGEIITNGHYLTQDVVQELLALNITSAQVTFEGSRRLHERIRRPLDRASGSYDTLVDNMGFAAVAMAVTARIHVAPYSLHSIPELLQDLAQRGLASRLKLVYFAPLFSYGGENKTFTSDDRRFLSSKDFAEVEIGLLTNAKHLGFRIPDPLNVSYDICVAMQRGSLVIGPDGDLFKCYLDVSDSAGAVGHVSSGVNATLLAPWAEYDFSTDQICETCTFLPVCLGGCPKQEMSSADKSVICTPLKFNYHQRMSLNFNH